MSGGSQGTPPAVPGHRRRRRRGEPRHVAERPWPVPDPSASLPDPRTEYVIALAGNPNCGKTTVFNAMCGTRQHVGNYPGVTVERREGFCRAGAHRIRVIDLPGTYALRGGALDEQIARDTILNRAPDVVVNIVDASNLERNLYLTTQLLELGVPMVLALNMSDIAAQRGEQIDADRLADLLGVEVVRTVGHRRTGVADLLAAVVRVARDPSAGSRPRRVPYGADLEHEMDVLAAVVPASDGAVPGRRWLALKLLERDPEIEASIRRHTDDWARIEPVLEASRKRLRTRFRDDAEVVVSDRRYGFVRGTVRECLREAPVNRITRTERIDRVLANRVLGLPVFLGLMWFVFTLAFRLGERPMQWIESAMAWLGRGVTALLPAGPLQSLIVDGVIAGVGGVLAFVPQILILFLAIALLEDTGYMARAAFLMDRVMHLIGLHGKSFIPLLIGFGCSVPAYMASRTLESRRDRLVTMHVTTFMSCGARLPVYVLVCGAFWPGAQAGNVMFSIYVLGAVVAILVARVLRGTRFRGPSEPFVMELPPYRLPTLRGLVIHAGERGWLYLRKAGTLILAASVVLWALMDLPRSKAIDDRYDAEIAPLRAAGLSDASPEILMQEQARAAEQLRYSVAGRMGRFLEPALAPLGFDWRLGITLVAGAAAKEVIVSTLGTLYSVEGVEGEGSRAIRERLAADPKYGPLVAYTFLVFVLLYMPCIAAVAVFHREQGRARETLFQILYTTGLAYVMSFVIYRGGLLLGLG